MAPRIYGVRHGVVHNPDHVVYARLPGFVLSDDGVEAAERLAAGALALAPVVAVYASPLERAQQTAGILAAPHGLEVRTEPRLIEWSFWTRWEGTPWMDLRDRHPDVFSAYAADPGVLCPEDPLQATGDGIVTWAEEAAAEHQDGIVLAVSHEAPLKAAYLSARGEPTTGYPRLEVGHLAAVRLTPGPIIITRLEEEELNARGDGVE